MASELIENANKEARPYGYTLEKIRYKRYPKKLSKNKGTYMANIHENEYKDNDILAHAVFHGKTLHSTPKVQRFIVFGPH